MKIVFTGPFSFPGNQASSSRIRNIAHGMLENGLNVRIVSLYGCSDNTLLDAYSNFSHKFVKIQPKFPSNKMESLTERIGMYYNFPKLLKLTIAKLSGSESEVLFVYGRSSVYIAMLFLSLKIKSYKTKMVFDVVEPHRTQDSLLEYIKHPFLFDSFLVYKFQLNFFDIVTYITKALLDRYPVEKNKSYIFPGVMINKKEEFPDILSKDKIKLGYLGALIEKDFPELIFKFCKELDDAKVSWELSIIGRYKFFKEGREWEDRFNLEFSAEQLKFYNSPSDDKKMKALDIVDYVLMFRKPSKLQIYTFPTRSVEVMSMGKIIITNEFGEFCQYIIDNNAGVVLNYQNLKESVSKWLSKLDPNAENDMRNESLKLLKNNFNAYEHCKNLIKKLKEL
jgi:glycosyltransferase involved in cell wall biosynthesis